MSKNNVLSKLANPKRFKTGPERLNSLYISRISVEKMKQTRPENNHQRAFFHIITLAAFSLGGLWPGGTMAAEFAGSLDSVSITDAAATNTPPVAVIAHTQDGDTFTFDATGSSDTDGQIVEYRWELDDGTTGEEEILEATLSASEQIVVTLTVIDNNQSITIAQKTIAPQSIGTGPNLIPNADDIQQAGWIASGVVRSSSSTWAEDGSRNWAFLGTPVFPVENGKTYTLSFDYISATTPLKIVSRSSFTPGGTTTATTESWQTSTTTWTATETRADMWFRFQLEAGTASTHSASIRNLTLMEN